MPLFSRSKQYFGNSWLYLTGALLLMLLIGPAVRQSHGCSPVDRSFRGFSFLDPAIVDPEAKAAPFFLPFAEIYEAFGGQELVQVTDNVTEWRERFCNQPKAKDIYQVVYKASRGAMERIRMAALNPRFELDPTYRGNSFARHLARNRCIEVIDYLLFAKECEPHVTLTADPWEKTPRNEVLMNALIDDGAALIPDIESHYVRVRYAYQVIRLAHYSGQYERVLDLYDELRPLADNDSSLVDYWIEGHRAGALTRLGRNVEAAYLYAQIFDNCPSKRESAFRSFRIKTDEEWRQCLLMCNNDQERIALYALRAHAADSRAVEEMEKIYDLDPTSEHLEILLVRELSKLEKNLLGLPFNRNREANRRYHKIPRPWAGPYVVAMQTFVRRVTREGRTARPALWKIAEGYLELLAGEYYFAARTFANARTMLGRRQEVLARQLEKFELALTISAWETIADTVEAEAVNIIRNDPTFRSEPDFRNFLLDKMAALYEENGNPGMAFLCHHSLEDLRPNPKPRLVDDLLAAARKEERNRFEKVLVEPREGETIADDILDMKAVYQLSDFRPEAALASLKEMEPVWDNYGLFNPFVERIRDCVHCPLPSGAEVFNRRSLVQRLVSLEYQANSGPSNRDSIYYQLGLGWYNMTYFGQAWAASDYFRSGASLQRANLRDGDNVVPHYRYPLGNRENFDCSRALYFFEQARLFTTNPELGARAAFMAAKCKRNEYYVNRSDGAQRDYHHFDILLENYRDTEFYNRIIAECKTFASYANKR